MLDHFDGKSESSEFALPLHRSAREEQRRRNALARRELEIRRERQRLRAALSDVWDEIDGAEQRRDGHGIHNGSFKSHDNGR